MKKILSLLFLILMVGGFSACEKDDICDAGTSTTPRLVIQFYDFNNRSVLKNVNNLKVTADDLTNAVILNPAATTDAGKYLSNANQIALPLNTAGDVVDYDLVLNAGADDSTPLTDELQFNYTRNTIYISRACGYSILFHLNEDNSLADAVILNGTPNQTEGNWIKDITVQTYNLISENETHLKIYF